MVWLITGVVLLLLVGAMILYNRFVRLQQMVREAWSGIDVQLKRRADIIPNLVQVVSGYAKYERSTQEAITGLRAAQQTDGSAGERSRVENALTQSVKSLIAVAEAYPDLKASAEFLALQHTLVDVEDQIQFARRYYNGAVRNFNILVHSFPSSILAAICHFTPVEYFEIEFSTERATPGVDMTR